MSINFYVKTKQIEGDRRIEKEWLKFNERGLKVNLFYAANDKVNPKVANFGQINKVYLLGGAAPSNLILRLFGAVTFCIFSFFKAIFCSKSKIHWVNDPILFPLIILFSARKSQYIIWDHHELPPDWVLKSHFVKLLFKAAYRRANCIIHTNSSRKVLLEEKLQYNHSCVFYLPNYPMIKEMGEYDEVSLSPSFYDKPFVFLQSTFGEKRADIEIFKALKEAGINAVHAGSIDYKRLKEIEKEIGSLDFCNFLGHLNIAQINWLLKRCLCTLIFYKKVSSNNWLCDPNRLYQSVAQNTWVIAGNNPTLEHFLKGYERSIVVDSDGSEQEKISQALEILKHKGEKQSFDNFNSSFSAKYWESCDEIFEHISKVSSAYD